MTDQESKTVSLEDINKVVPRLTRLFQDITQIRFQLKDLYTKLDEVGLPPDEIGEDDSDVVSIPNEHLRDFIVFRGLLDTLKDWILKVEEYGCKVTDVECGICEFEAEIERRDIKLSWRFGEPDIAFWYEKDQEFADRKPLETLLNPKAEQQPARLI